jgi:hypothetical protein
MLPTAGAVATRAQPGWRPARGHPHARIRDRSNRLNDRPMDIEQVNAIGTLLADLSARTEQLRGYL